MDIVDRIRCQLLGNFLTVTMSFEGKSDSNCLLSLIRERRLKLYLLLLHCIATKYSRLDDGQNGQEFVERELQTNQLSITQLFTFYNFCQKTCDMNCCSLSFLPNLDEVGWVLQAARLRPIGPYCHCKSSGSQVVLFGRQALDEALVIGFHLQGMSSKKRIWNKNPPTVRPFWSKLRGLKTVLFGRFFVRIKRTFRPGWEILCYVYVSLTCTLAHAKTRVHSIETKHNNPWVLSLR